MQCSSAAVAVTKHSEKRPSRKSLLPTSIRSVWMSTIPTMSFIFPKVRESDSAKQQSERMDDEIFECKYCIRCAASYRALCWQTDNHRRTVSNSEPDPHFLTFYRGRPL